MSSFLGDGDTMQRAEKNRAEQRRTSFRTRQLTGRTFFYFFIFFEVDMCEFVV